LVSFFIGQRTTIVPYNLAYPCYESALPRPERLAVLSTVHHIETIRRNASGKANGQELAELVAQGKLHAAK
jgi:hypothetical protein